jgi:ornithine cyclodeaminase
MSPRVYSAAEVHAALPWPALAAALEAAFVEARTEVPLRHTHALAPDGVLLLMPAWSDDALGVKVVTVIPGAVARGAATVAATYLLLDRATGQAKALLDGEALTVRRTAAASALAAQRLAAPGASRLLVVGAGHLAPWMARAHVALNPALREVAVWARRADASRALAAQLRGEGVDALAVDDLEKAVRHAHVICCATTSSDPLVLGRWLAPGTHLDLVGAYRPTMREVDDDAVRLSQVVVDTRAGALKEAGDIVQPIERGLIGADHVRADLSELLTGNVVVRTDALQVTLFKSVGTALEDLAAARCVVAGTAA